MKHLVIKLLNILHDCINIWWHNIVIPICEWIKSFLIKLLNIGHDFLNRLWNNLIVPMYEWIKSVIIRILNIVHDCLNRMWNNLVVPTYKLIENMIITIYQYIINTWNYIIYQCIKTILVAIGDYILVPIFQCIKYLVVNIFDTIVRITNTSYRLIVSLLTLIFDFMVHIYHRVFTGYIWIILGQAHQITISLLNGIHTVIANVIYISSVLATKCLNYIHGLIIQTVNLCIGGVYWIRDNLHI
jgi:hypothetical protein